MYNGNNTLDKLDEDHTIEYLIHFTLHAGYTIGVGVIRVVVHLLAQNPRELVVHRVSKGGESCTTIRLDKLSMDVFQKRERNPSCDMEDGKVIAKRI